MRWQIMVARGKRKGTVIPISRSSFVIGRDSTCQLRASAASVSRQHCILMIREGRLFVVDCKTTNGTFVNGQRLEHRRELHTGDRLRLGPLDFLIQLSSQRSKKRPQWDEETVGELLLRIDDEKNSTTASATISDAHALSDTQSEHEVAAPKDNDAATQPAAPKDSASAAEALLGKYARRNVFVHTLSQSSKT